MKTIRSFCGKIALALFATVFGAETSALAQEQRVLGLDVSAWQGNLSTTAWASFKRSTNQQVNGVFGDSRDFVLIRSSRGGTTGYYNQSDANNTNGLNTLSQRYDDPYFVQNINRATGAGLFAGSYHFNRADIVASTLNSGGIANTGTDEADHMIQMAGAWMRPGYLLPVLDLEAGAFQHSTASLSSWAIAFSDRIYQQAGIRPMIYVNSSYANSEVNSTVAASMPSLWIARPTSGNPLTTEPPPALPTYPNVYGVWNPSYPNTPTPQPWTFWQYNTGGGLNSYGGNIDKNVANGGMEFLKDSLVPAIWMNDSSGNWNTLSNWNSGQATVAPVQGPGQVARVGALILPTPRLPGAAGGGVTSGQHDSVILERPNANIAVTLSSGTHNIRKLYVREALNITGGSLAINYVPSWNSTTNAAQFSAPVTLSDNASLSVHTLQVDTTRTFTLSGGNLTFNTINLMPHSTTPAKIVMSGNVNLNPLANATAIIQKGAGSGASGLLDLGGGNRTITVGNGSAAVDFSLDIPVINGGLTKAGLGTMRLTSVSGYAGGTTLSAGTLLVNNATGSGTGSGAVTVNGGTLGGTGTIAGSLTLNSGGTLSPGLSIGTLTLNSAATLNGTTLMEINRNGGSSLADKIVVTSGAVNYGGTLVVSNVGATFVGGEVFTNFTASSYAGAFANTVLPTLNSGLNWYLGHLTTNGTIKVNRRPTANMVTLTNGFSGVLQIPIATLINGTDLDGDTLSFSNFATTTNGITLSNDSTFLIYSNNVNVADQFAFTLSDNRGGFATNVVNIVPSPVVIGTFAQQPIANGNSVTLHFSGTPGATYYVDRSTNLPPSWLTIWTNIAPESGLFDYTDDFDNLSESPASSFYRLRW